MKHLRDVVHEGCPDVEETVKWGHASFTYHGILCGMAAFKEHASFGFWKGKLIVGKDGKSADEGMGNFGKLTRVSDLPSKKVLLGYVKQAAKLNETGTKVQKPKGKPKPKIPVPADLAAALKKNKKAAATFAAFSPSNQREYLEWITEAKQEATRARASSRRWNGWPKARRATGSTWTARLTHGFPQVLLPHAVLGVVWDRPQAAPRPARAQVSGTGVHRTLSRAKGSEAWPGVEPGPDGSGAAWPDQAAGRIAGEVTAGCAVR